jgi:hypothetical protein
MAGRCAFEQHTLTNELFAEIIQKSFLEKGLALRGPSDEIRNITETNY